jgi:hypothetical protein
MAGEPDKTRVGRTLARAPHERKNTTEERRTYFVLAMTPRVDVNCDFDTSCVVA